MKRFLIIFLLLSIVFCSSCIKIKNSTNLTFDEIFVSVTEKELSDFDNWLTKEVGLDWVPSYLVLDGHNVLGIIKGGLSASETKEKLVELKNNPMNILMCDLDIYNPFSKTTTTFIQTLPETGLNIIEVHMIGCKDCEEVDGIPGEYRHPKLDENGEFIDGEYETIIITGNELCSTDEIRQAIDANFYRYYVRSTNEDIIEKYI